jgi:hypothetical protein
LVGDSKEAATLFYNTNFAIDYSSKQQGGIVLKAHIVSVCFKCFKCFKYMLQVFHEDVAKVVQDVAMVMPPMPPRSRTV